MLSIRYRFTPKSLSGISFDSGLGNFARYSSIIQDVGALQAIASKKEERLALAIVDGTLLVGYALCGRPDPGERWSRLGKLMYEMQAIEVSRNFRKRGIARHMVETILCDDFFEDKIAYLNGFCWHWDLEGSGLSILRYREMMGRLMETYGFLECYSNEPNLALRTENIFMARIGSRVSIRDRQRFRYLRFGLTEPRPAPMDMSI